MKKDNWTIKIIVMAFMISFVFSSLSETIMPKVSLIPSIIILIIFILIGIIFDMIGVAITTCDIKPFHSMSSKRIKYANTGIKLINNSAKVSSFCNDVIGDICGIVSGGVAAIIGLLLAIKYGFSQVITIIIISSIISSLTVGGKAIGKKIAIKNSDEIVFYVAKVLSNFKSQK